MSFGQIMYDVFGQRPNQRNLKQFFGNEAIQALWWSVPEADGDASKAGFIQSERLREILSESPIGEREKVQQLFEKVAPAGLSILP